jgi:hypothetical protein
MVLLVTVLATILLLNRLARGATTMASVGALVGTGIINITIILTSIVSLLFVVVVSMVNTPLTSSQIR